MPWQADRNVGSCTLHTCRATLVPRCDAFFCESCCRTNHSQWNAHRQPDGTVTGIFQDTRVGYNSNHAAWCNCIACKRDRVVKPDPPVEWDYDGFPPEFNEPKELGADYERCFVPLSNYKANKEWPADYIG